MRNTARKMFVLIAAALLALMLLAPATPADAGSSERVVLDHLSASHNSNCGVNGADACGAFFSVPAGPDYQLGTVTILMQQHTVSTIPIRATLWTVSGSNHDTRVADISVASLVSSFGNGAIWYEVVFNAAENITLTGGQDYFIALNSVTGAAYTMGASATAPAASNLFSSPGNGWINAAGVMTPATFYTVMKITVLVEDDTPPILDGRANAYDAAAMAAVYCQDAGGLHIYSIDAGGAGILAFVVEQADIEAASIPGPDDLPVLIKASEDGTVRLYRLPTGEFQVNAPTVDGHSGAHNENGYVFTWNAC